MRDRDVRRALLRDLAAQYAADPSTRIVEELGLDHGARRADVVVVNGELHGFEIKSEADDLARLPGQAEIYGAVFDRVTVVAAGKHIAPALAIVPAWYGIVAADMRDGSIGLTEQRRAESNPRRNPLLLAQLLWRDELQALLERREPNQAFARWRRRELIARAAGTLSVEELSGAVRTALKARPGWRVAIPPA